MSVIEIINNDDMRFFSMGVELYKLISLCLCNSDSNNMFAMYYSTMHSVIWASEI